MDFADIAFLTVIVLVHVLLWPGNGHEQMRWTPVPRD